MKTLTAALIAVLTLAATPAFACFTQEQIDEIQIRSAILSDDRGPRADEYTWDIAIEDRRASALVAWGREGRRFEQLFQLEKDEQGWHVVNYSYVVREGTFRRAAR